jgi:hypothetical protein
VALRDRWAAALGSEERRPSFSILACELEAQRAQALDQRLQWHDQVFAGDCFRLLPSSPAGTGCTVLYLNPPYDQDPEHRRLEQRFLARFTSHLHPGSGILLYLVPPPALAASARFLATHYLDVRAWRLPDPEFQNFRQILLVARRGSQALPEPSRFQESALLSWAERPERLPVLPEVCPEPIEVDAAPQPAYQLDYRLESLDFSAGLETFRALEAAPTGSHLDARALRGARFPTAVPPRPAHLALALTSGMINGRRIQPDDLPRHPPLLVKGAVVHTRVEVSRRRNGEGEVTGVVEVERPELRLTILRLDTYAFHRLTQGSIPTGSSDLADWNAADLLRHYSRSLARVLAEQFPALHDPAEPRDQFSLPEFPRKLFGAQAHAVRACLKLLATGTNPMVVAEVGTGKSTMALSVAGALSPAHHDDTSRELRRLGFTRPLPRVSRVLVVCPPHLLDTWRTEAAAVLPQARVQVVRSVADLEREAEVYVLSRETAKLGSSVQGLEGRCPRCGAPVERSAAENAERRRRCEAIRCRPTNGFARRAEQLAALLVPVQPRHPVVSAICPGAALRRRFIDVEVLREARPLSLDRIAGFEADLLADFETLIRAGAPWAEIELLLEVLASMSRAVGSRSVCRAVFDRFLSLPESAALRKTLLDRLADLGNTTDPDEAGAQLHLLHALEQLYRASTWTKTGPCGEHLYQLIPRPRRYPLARLILRRFRRLFQLLVID